MKKGSQDKDNGIKRSYQQEDHDDGDQKDEKRITRWRQRQGMSQWQKDHDNNDQEDEKRITTWRQWKIAPKQQQNQNDDN